MKKSLNSTLVEITRAQSRDDFRRDQFLIPKSHYQLERINRQLKKLAREKKS